MFEERVVRAGLRSHATRRRAVAIALVVGSISLPSCRPPARVRRLWGPKAATRQALPNYGVIWEGRTSPRATLRGSATGPPLTRPAAAGSIRPLTRLREAVRNAGPDRRTTTPGG